MKNMEVTIGVNEFTLIVELLIAKLELKIRGSRTVDTNGAQSVILNGSEGDFRLLTDRLGTVKFLVDTVTPKISEAISNVKPE
ncbi:hypothetical protein [Mucilaginibacter paludis]|uniref:Uncharacterized protein n=1 Tax=Mucilaginibacter paludis DSM 18603 TaxID=714943 RepID=H1Y6Z2_9SPHI|nr:hypothetical protein [Mucilaginibacter paludis]EHQ28399.1 hypothetical protein Mucpa_4309 [Mucilaginibacter paludis DSM 18603]